MSKVDYSMYGSFVVPMWDLLPQLPQMVQDHFNQVMEDEIYGTPKAPKDSKLLKFTINEDEEQMITPLSILVKCISRLYKAMHSLGPFANRIELGRQMRTRANLFVANKQWDASHILNIKIEGPMNPGHNDEQSYLTKVETSISARGDTPTFDQVEFNHCLVGCDATPGPTPELNMLTNHHLKVLSGLNDKMRWDEQDLLDPRTVSVHAWQCKMLVMLSVVPFA
ncbi:hypothetical protein NDA14_007905 [Ustilago hordei]|nr:hypothetical protein NDA15_000098 [Ustilago hordei]KAJ1583010.1 hypothetical protein NDA12_007221 [Ustilago hordei]KAJ1600052.1 hypothetical protein NDA14_007905 [Ustilago hordei]UTT92383.1 hypothetical protein NDA17_007621 [Ustilago hordei]